MSLGGGGSSAPTSTTVNQSSLPAYAEPYFTQLMGASMDQALRPYQQYQGQQIADISPFQNQAWQNLSNMGDQSGATDPSNALAGNVGSTSQQVERNAQQFNPNITQSQWTSPGTASSYMSPYTQNVLDAQKANMQVDFGAQKQAQDAQAAQAGAFGGDRQAIQDQMLARTQQQQLQSMEAQGLQNAYNTGNAAFNADANRNMQGQIAQGQLGLGGINAQIGALNPQLGASAQLTNNALGQQSLGLNQANALAQAGTSQQTQQQNLLNQAHTDWQNAGNWAQNQLGWYSGVLHGVPVQPQNTQTNFTAAPSMTSGIAGLGAAAAGLGALNGTKAGG